MKRGETLLFFWLVIEVGFLTREAAELRVERIGDLKVFLGCKHQGGQFVLAEWDAGILDFVMAGADQRPIPRNEWILVSGPGFANDYLNWQIESMVFEVCVTIVTVVSTPMVRGIRSDDAVVIDYRMDSKRGRR